MAEAKRKQIKKKVAAAESRNEARSERTAIDRAGEKAIEAKDKFTAFAREHPVATVAGGLAIGVLVSMLFRGSPTRKAGKKLGTRAAGLAAIGAELAMAYAQQAWEAAEEAGRTGAAKLDEFGETIGRGAHDLGGDAAGYAASARAKARKAGKSISGAVRSRLN
jgi:hypothetical protein